MVKTLDNYANVEKLLCLVAENQKFAKPKDKLTTLIEKFSCYMSEELTESDLEFATAAKMPEIPKYKTLKDV